MTSYEIIDLTLDCDTGGLAAGDVLCATQSLGNTRAGVLESCELINLDDKTTGIILYFMSANASIGAEDAAFAPSDTAVVTFLTRLDFASGSWVDHTNSLYQVKTSAAGDAGMGVYLKNDVSATNHLIYVGAVANATGTFTVNGLRLRVGLRYD